eukprot:COSAG01_NODE_1741_length_9356_cov_13.065572_3_plen_242_part_00
MCVCRWAAVSMSAMETAPDAPHRDDVARDGDTDHAAAAAAATRAHEGADFGSLAIFWEARVRSKVWRARQRRAAAGEHTSATGAAGSVGGQVMQHAADLLELVTAADGSLLCGDADAAHRSSVELFSRQLRGLRFEPVPLLDGAITVFGVPSSLVPRDTPQLVSEAALLCSQAEMAAAAAAAPALRGDGDGDASAEAEDVVARGLRGLGLLRPTAQRPEEQEQARVRSCFVDTGVADVGAC